MTAPRKLRSLDNLDMKEALTIAKDRGGIDWVVIDFSGIGVFIGDLDDCLDYVHAHWRRY